MAEAERLGRLVVDAQFVQCLAHVEIGLADGDDAEAGVGTARASAVEPVGPPVGECRRLNSP
jgi:hypothetical protein